MSFQNVCHCHGCFGVEALLQSAWARLEGVCLPQKYHLLATIKNKVVKDQTPVMWKYIGVITVMEIMTGVT